MIKFIKDFLTAQINFSSNEISKLEKRISEFSSVEKGTLEMSVCKGTKQYYVYYKDRKREYLPKRNKERLSAFLQNRNDLLTIRVLKKWLKECVRFSEAYADYNENYATLEQLRILDEGKSWSEMWPRNYQPTDEFRIKTLRGDYVRSKSEGLIADRLFLCGLQYRYEPRLIMDDYRYFIPDFLIVHPFSGELILWEHFGRLDDANYAKRTCEKMSYYTKCGYAVGKNFTVTFEVKESPIDIEIVEYYIEQLFGTSVKDSLPNNHIIS